MTTEIDAEGLRAAWRALNSDDLTEEGEVTREALHSAILAYLATTRTSEAEPVAWVSDEILAAMKRGDRAVPGWKRSDVFSIPLYAGLPTPASDDQVEAVTDEMVERAALALAKRNHVPEWREFIPDARAALLAAMAYPSKKDGELEFQVSGTGELADAYRDLAARQTDTEPDIAKVVRDNRSELYMPLDDATVRSGEEG